MTIETDELVLSDLPRRRAWCIGCRREVDVIPLAVVEFLQGSLADTEAHRLVGAGALMVCINSLIRRP